MRSLRRAAAALPFMSSRSPLARRDRSSGPSLTGSRRLPRSGPVSRFLLTVFAGPRSGTARALAGAFLLLSLGALAADPAQAQTTPSATISAGTSQATEGEDVRFKVTLSSPAPTGMYINITVADATGGGDFLPSSREGLKGVFIIAGTRSGGYGAIPVDDHGPNGQVTATLRAGSGCTPDASARG